MFTLSYHACKRSKHNPLAPSMKTMQGKITAKTVTELNVKYQIVLAHHDCFKYLPIKVGSIMEVR